MSLTETVCRAALDLLDGSRILVHIHPGPSCAAPVPESTSRSKKGLRLSGCTTCWSRTPSAWWFATSAARVRSRTRTTASTQVSLPACRVAAGRITEDGLSRRSNVLTLKELVRNYNSLVEDATRVMLRIKALSVLAPSGRWVVPSTAGRYARSGSTSSRRPAHACVLSHCSRNSTCSSSCDRRRRRL